MPMCKFRCDDLFEKGYISVINGEIKVNKKTVTDPLEIYLDSIKGLNCKYWSDATKIYFEWHNNHHSNYN